LIFFGYATGPRSGADAIRTVARVLKRSKGLETQLWVKMLVDGRVIIGRILEQIDSSEMCIFDLTKQSENVLFEVGYAIAKAKPMWLTLDETVRDATSDWKELALLNPIGYTPYMNSRDLIRTFEESDPLNTLTPAYDDLIEPVLPTSRETGSLLYCSTFEPFEASNRLSTFLDNRRSQGLKIITSDPKESTLDAITWYAPRTIQAPGVIVHFAGGHRNRSWLYNRRHALVAGMAHGFEIPLLMLAEEGYLVPFDYQTLLHKYESASDCVRKARAWLDSLTFEGIDWKSPRATPRSSLSGLRFGEHVAENELAELIDYFVETSAYEEVVTTRDAIFVGHRGTGKTANATQAYESVAANKNNLAVLIKPPGFEFPALFSSITKLGDTQRDYFLDSLWRFIIQTEIAATILTRIEGRSAGIPLSREEQAFIIYIDSAPFNIRADVSIRLEQALDYLSANLPETPAAGATTRNLINEAFHEAALVELRKELGPILKGKERVAVFVDNLDKGWERGADFRLVARLILGLLTARGRLIRDFNRQDWWRDQIKLTVAMFLRSDIYEYLRKEAREPDKLPVSTIAWRDPATLLAVIEARFEVSASNSRRASDLWRTYFCTEVRGQSTKEYVASVVLPRPRDIVYFCNSAVGRALDRRHNRVEQDDFLAAEETYSQYAYEALLVENGVTIPDMEDVLLGFLEAPAVLTKQQIYERLGMTQIPSDRYEQIITKLITISFLGLETRPEKFTFPEVGSEMRRAYAQASRRFPDPQLRRFYIHRAFHSFLEIVRTDPQ
jgi:hypothetical protein